jgi:hypothetical protein
MKRPAALPLLRVILALTLVVQTSSTAGFGVAAVRAAGTGAGGLLVSVAYAEDKETNNPNPAAFPVPWQGSPNTIFLGGPVVGQTQCGTLPTCFDTGAIRLDNPTAAAISVSDVSVDIHSSIAGGKVFDLWGSFTVPAGESVILAENPPGDTAGSDDFDTSGFPGNQCTPITVAPTVTITIGGVKTTIADSTHVLDTGGIDVGFCNTGAAKNESIAWRSIGAPGSPAASLSLAPGSVTQPAGGSATETATLLDGGGDGLANVAVAFAVTSGPNAGRTGSAITDSLGHASFMYTDSVAGTDIVAASVATIGTFQTQSMVVWGSGTTPTWSGADIGSPPLAGSDSFAGGVWTISGSGRDIGGTTDQFHFVSQPLAGDGALAARVVTQTNSNSRARAGVMLRQSLDPASPFYAAVVTPGAGVWVLERASFGAQVATLLTTAGTVPVFLRVDRAGAGVSASTSSDGVTWTPLAGSAATFSVSGTVLAGLAVTSHTSTKVSTATFDSLQLTGGTGLTPTPTVSPSPTPTATPTPSPTATPTPTPTPAPTPSPTPTATPTPSPTPTPAPTPSPTPTATPTPSPTPTASPSLAPTPSPGGLPSPWLDTDVGAPSPAGSASYSGGVFGVNGEGTDIFGTADQFNYVYQPTTGNGTIVARVVSESNAGSTNDKAGVIWKASTTARSPYILIAVSYTGLVKVQYNFSGSVTTSTYAFPNVWMKLVRSGSSFSAYLSPDGVTWTSVVANESLPTIPSAATVGIYECSHSPGVLGTAAFDNVSFTPGP